MESFTGPVEHEVPLAQVDAPSARNVRGVHTPMIEAVAMPAMDYTTYAEQTKNPYLLLGAKQFADHVIVFTGAGGRKTEAVDRDHHTILSAAGMRNPERVLSARDTLHSEHFPIVAYAVIPRAELHTCMRDADIREHTSIIELRKDLNQQLRARTNEMQAARGI